MRGGLMAFRFGNYRKLYHFDFDGQERVFAIYVRGKPFKYKPWKKLTISNADKALKNIGNHSLLDMHIGISRSAPKTVILCRFYVFLFC